MMIAHLSGLLINKTPQSIIIDTSGIGHEVFVPLSTFYALPEEKESINLHIYTHVREDALLLFGFHTKLEKKLFLMLISISGIGPKLAVNILSGKGPQDLLDAIACGDAVRLRSIPGVGKKTAERIALELRDRASQMMGGPDASPTPIQPSPDKHIVDDALSALLNLGYSPKSAKPAVAKAQTLINDLNLEALIKESLRILA